ncbi:Sfi1-domain-containing protein [Zopfia rhizophila CBS 207.26]|uniref:Sfi1-domain-containing protein n=1 Tax=Zopfia rhizophila CBS 207.26 TaxID=1314779 RepID=A0A6A6D878_9PEZI|nr:Sfi1-domain-containing protein [Zopfia rhizophila CBS 207.26]
MPPSMIANHDELPPLSNNDIEILYDIVRHAQILPGPPFRALFTAYDRVLLEKGINPDHDQIYFRFLFRMQEAERREGDGKGDNRSLVERFRRLLAGMGIDVECDPEGEGIEEITRHLDNVGVNGAPQSLGGATPAKAQSRRGSFDSYFNGARDKTGDMDTGQERQASSRRGSRGTASYLKDRRRARSQSQAHSQLLARLPIRSRENGNGRGRTVPDNVPSRPRPNSVSSRGSLEIQRDVYAGAHGFGDYDGDESEQTDIFDLSHVQIPGVNAPIPAMTHELAQHYVPQEMLYRPSNTQMLDDAETFEDRRVRTVARKCIKKLRDQASDIRETLEDMNARSYAFDRNVLLRQSFDSWKAGLQEKRRIFETERFFERLEGRAEKARSLFLLTKAFTHWAKSAEDEVQRTSVARRHILRTKYFNAWRDITAVNEFKVQHHILGKFLSIWRKRAGDIQHDNFKALAFYNENLVYRVYWKWFWAFCERAAPSWYMGRLKRNLFTKWVEITRLLEEREDWVTHTRQRNVRRQTLQRMSENVVALRNLAVQADNFRRRTSLSFGFYSLRNQAQLAPLAAQVSQRVDIRILRTAFQTWRRNALLSRKANNVGRMRMLRNTWTAWNDRLRIQYLAIQINDRVLVNALYKWTLASRASAFVRVHNAGLQQSAFKTLVDKSRGRQTRSEDAERRFASFKRCQISRFALKKIENATIARRNEEYLALSQYEPKIIRKTFATLLDRHNHLQLLNTWAEDARFYVLASGAIKKWSEATQHARRNRRRETYAQVRRMVKMNLVKRVFVIWRNKSAQLAIKNREVNDYFENKVLSTSTTFFAQWRERTAILRDHESQAVQRCNAKIATKYFGALVQRHQYLRTLDQHALALARESTGIAATGAFKKLEWRLFQIQRQEENALALQQRNFDKHLKAMLRFWAEQTVERVAQRPVSPSPSILRCGGHEDGDYDGDEGGLGDGEGEDTRRLENWTAFDESALGLSNLDLSLSFSPEKYQRPATHPASISVSRPPPFPEEFSGEIEGLGVPFATSTPVPLPGYLKTPTHR